MLGVRTLIVSMFLGVTGVSLSVPALPSGIPVLGLACGHPASSGVLACVLSGGGFRAGDSLTISYARYRNPYDLPVERHQRLAIVNAHGSFVRPAIQLSVSSLYLITATVVGGSGERNTISIDGTHGAFLDWHCATVDAVGRTTCNLGGHGFSANERIDFRYQVFSGPALRRTQVTYRHGFTDAHGSFYRPAYALHVGRCYEILVNTTTATRHNSLATDSGLRQDRSHCT